MKNFAFGSLSFFALIAGLAFGNSRVVVASEPAPTPVSDCSDGSYKCGYGQTWTCCNSGDRCCSYTGTDNQTWYTCRTSGSSCD